MRNQILSDMEGTDTSLSHIFNGKMEQSSTSTPSPVMGLNMEERTHGPWLGWWHQWRTRERKKRQRDKRRKPEDNDDSEDRAAEDAEKMLELSVLAGDSGRGARMSSTYFQNLETFLKHQERDVWLVRTFPFSLDGS